MRAIVIVLFFAAAIIAREVKVPCLSSATTGCAFFPLREALENAQDGDIISLATSGTYALPCAIKFGAPVIIPAKTITIDATTVIFYPEAHYKDGLASPFVPYDKITDCEPLHFAGDVVWRSGGFGLPYLNISAAGSISFVVAQPDARFPSPTYFANNLRGFYGIDGGHPRVTLQAGNAINIQGAKAHDDYIFTMRTPRLTIADVSPDAFPKSQLCGCGDECFAITGPISTSCPGIKDDTDEGASLIDMLPTVECLSTLTWAPPLGIGIVLGVTISALLNHLCARRVTGTCEARDSDDSSPPGYETDDVSTDEHDEKAKALELEQETSATDTTTS